MKTAFLIRELSDAQGTFGTLMVPGEPFLLDTIELPWRNNEPYISCIPTGIYTVEFRWTKDRGRHYIVTDVKGRTYILFHFGNVAGRKPEFKTHAKGCILPGLRRGKLFGQKSVQCSKLAMKKMFKTFGRESFTLIIKNKGE